MYAAAVENFVTPQATGLEARCTWVQSRQENSRDESLEVLTIIGRDEVCKSGVHRGGPAMSYMPAVPH